MIKLNNPTQILFMARGSLKNQGFSFLVLEGSLHPVFQIPFKKKSGAWIFIQSVAVTENLLSHTHPTLK